MGSDDQIKKEGGSDMFNKTKWMAVVGAGGLVVVVALTLVAGIASAQGPGSWGQWGGMMGGWRAPQDNGSAPGWQGYGYGMMGGWRGRQSNNEDSGWQGYGTGMMGRGAGTGYGYGPGTGFTCPGLGGWGSTNPVTSTGRISLEKVTQAAQQFVANLGNTDLEVTEVMEFDYNFYAQVQEQSSKINAFELLVDPYTGFVRPEPGPNMMWNTRYGHMAGWWGNGSQAQPGTMPVDAQKARELAQQYLDTNVTGTTAGTPETFYGYYTLHVTKDGQVSGMLSVNGSTGEVWYHIWHGDFVKAAGEEG
jgi:hypothetical protein